MIRKQCEINFLPVSALPRPSDAKIETLQISGLKPYDNEAILKEIAKKHHVIEVNTEFDNVKGICTGKGRITIRSFPHESDKKDLTLKLKNQGYSVAEMQVNNNKKYCSEWIMQTNKTARRELGSEKPCITKENLPQANTPRYMRPTTSSANRFFR